MSKKLTEERHAHIVIGFLGLGLYLLLFNGGCEEN